jgi:hypothetical protein
MSTPIGFHPQSKIVLLHHNTVKEILKICYGDEKIFTTDVVKLTKEIYESLKERFPSSTWFPEDINNSKSNCHGVGWIDYNKKTWKFRKDEYKICIGIVFFDKGDIEGKVGIGIWVNNEWGKSAGFKKEFQKKTKSLNKNLEKNGCIPEPNTDKGWLIFTKTPFIELIEQPDGWREFLGKLKTVTNILLKVVPDIDNILESIEGK